MSIELIDLHMELSTLLSDEDLTDDQLREASEGLLVDIHDALSQQLYGQPEDCPHDRTLVDFTGKGTMTCRDCGLTLINRYGPEGDKMPAVER